MIANKHTELRIYDNLNSLLRASLDEKEYKERINRHISQYIRNYVDENCWEKSIYDIFEELGENYQKHCWNIAKRIKDEILEEKKETNWLDPNVYTKEFKETLKEELTNKVLSYYFKELNNQINVYEYKNKINNLRNKEFKSIALENKEKIKKEIRKRIEDTYKYCFNYHRGNSKLVLDNFDTIYNVKESMFDDVMDYLEEKLDIELDKSNIRPLYEKELKDFTKEKRAILGFKKESNGGSKDTLGKIINHPKLAKAVVISQMWKDITK